MASVVSVVIDRDTGGERRRVNYTITLQDNDGANKDFNVGPVMTTDPNFDASAHGVDAANGLLA